jgi:hypothetical protein
MHVKPLQPRNAESLLAAFADSKAYLHLEVNPGGFVRNVMAHVEGGSVRPDSGCYRVALRCRPHGWVVMEGITHVEDGPGILSFYRIDQEHRLLQVLQVAKEPFQP